MLRAPLSLLVMAAALASLTACVNRPGFDVPDTMTRDGGPTDPDAAAWIECQVGQTRCFGETFQRCVEDGEFTAVEQTDCRAMGQVCLADAPRCAVCRPGSVRCSEDAFSVERCLPDASGWELAQECDVPNGQVCRGEMCRSLCNDSEVIGSNVGCEYYAVDLDNASLDDYGSAVSQQFAIVVSNPDTRFSARVRIERNDAEPGATPRPTMVASAVIPPGDLEIFPLPPREVDCSMPGTYNTGTHTCLSSQAYRVTSTAPVIAVQFNPLENVFVYSNDASLLVPTNSLSGDYMAMSWPQTLASSPPEIVLNPSDPVDLRGFLTIVGTQPNTRVRVVPRADVVPGGPVAQLNPAGTPIEVTLGPFDVLNLETGAFQADFTGSTVTADRPVAVFSGSECSDVPVWNDVSNERRCCCDHLESQLFPRGTLGTHYIAVHTPSHTRAVTAAGTNVAIVENEPNFFRVMAVTPGMTHVRTTLPSDLEVVDSTPLEFDLMQGEFRTLRAYREFELQSSAPVYLASFMGGQGNTGIPLRYPGGDPSFVPMPPIEQWRRDYVFLTPDSYAFDFVTVVVPAGATATLDGEDLPTRDCEVSRGDGCVDTRRRTCAPSQYTVYRCQLSFPTVDPDLPYPQNIGAGRQRDGVHTLRATEPAGVIVSGFDLRVSYGYPAGTQLRPLF